MKNKIKRTTRADLINDVYRIHESIRTLFGEVRKVHILFEQYLEMKKDTTKFEKYLKDKVEEDKRQQTERK
tara:strand:+ start:2430 stop:2642 length:213 start_codon:yes stop_codon:yes gene_type:complete